MVRYCQATNLNGKPCKRICHDNVCGSHKRCICCTTNKNVITLTQCGHFFCKECLASDIYDFQWFADFSTEHPLLCPECDMELSDSDWQDSMDYLVNEGTLVRKPVYTCQIGREWISKLHHFVEFGKEYSFRERDIIENRFLREYDINLFYVLIPDDVPKVVYFQERHWSRWFPNTFYTFDIDYNLLSQQNQITSKELIEYIYHPTRVARLGIEFLDR
jgi:hypothetical protein